MRNGFLRSVAALLAGSSVALAQAPSTSTPVRQAEPPRFIAEQPQRLPAKPGVVVQTPPADTSVKPYPGTPADRPAYSPGQPGHPGNHCADHCADSCGPKMCDVCGPPGKCWVSVEYLLWWFKSGQTPPLATTSPATSLGILGQPGTTVIIGGEGLDNEPLHGIRVTVGTWLDCCQTKGIEIGGFSFFDHDTQRSASGPGTPGSVTIARPFFNVLTGQPDSQLVAFPSLVAGTVTVDSTQRLSGFTPNIICNLCCCGPVDCCNPHGRRIDLLVGPRFYRLEEDINIREDLQVNPTVPVLGGSRINIVDSFETENRFYGGFIGARAEFWMNRLFVNVTGGVALGNTEQIVRINGSTTITPPTGAVVTRAGGLLTQPTNIGRYSRNEFTYIPELGFNVGYQVTPQCRAFVGYSFLYWSEVVRPGDQIDVGLNTTQLPTLGGTGTLTGPARPAFTFHDSGFWAQGINLGVQFRL
jgi:hypothetical protein